MTCQFERVSVVQLEILLPKMIKSINLINIKTYQRGVFPNIRCMLNIYYKSAAGANPMLTNTLWSALHLPHYHHMITSNSNPHTYHLLLQCIIKSSYISFIIYFIHPLLPLSHIMGVFAHAPYYHPR